MTTSSLKSYQASYWEQREWLGPPDLLVVGGGIVDASLYQRLPAG